MIVVWLCDVYDGDMSVVSSDVYDGDMSVSKGHNNTSWRCGSRRCELFEVYDGGTILVAKTVIWF